MGKITSEQLEELDKLACEQYKLNLLIDYIKDPKYVVMYETCKGHFPLGNTVTEDDGELRVKMKNVFREPNAYIDLYNVIMEDIKVYNEINLND